MEETPKNQSIFQCKDHSSIFINIRHYLKYADALPWTALGEYIACQMHKSERREVREQKVMPFNGRHYQTVLDTNNYI